MARGTVQKAASNIVCVRIVRINGVLDIRLK